MAVKSSSQYVCVGVLPFGVTIPALLTVQVPSQVGKISPKSYSNCLSCCLWKAMVPAPNDAGPRRAQ